MALAFAMANLAIAPVVNAKLYRHFAAVTFAITLCVALFANGEARQVVGDGVGNQQQAAKLREADARKFGVKQIGDRRQRIGTRSGFGTDYDPSYGAASNPGGSRPDTRAHGESGERGFGVDGVATGDPPKVLSPDEMAQLTPAEQSAYLKRIRTQGAPTRDGEVHDLAAIEAGSRARSGGGGGGGD